MKKLIIILILFCSIQGFGQSTTGAQGYWKLNGNSNDYSGNGLNGTDYNIAYSGSYGRVLHGAAFNNTSSKIIITGTTNITCPFTVSFWVYFNTASTDGGSVFSKDLVTTNNRYIGYEVYSTSLTMYQWNTSNIIKGLALPISSGKWYLISYSWAADGIIKLYVNGVFYSQSSGNGTIKLNSTIQLWFGARQYASNPNYFNGNLCDVIWQNVVISNAQNKNEYAKATGFF